MEYDLIRLFEHPLGFRSIIPSAIVVLGSEDRGQCAVQVNWKQSTGDDGVREELVLTWNVAILRDHFAEIDQEIAILRERDEDFATQIELAATAIAIAVMSLIEPGTQFTRRASIGTGHDYYLNESRDEMIEIAGRWEGGLPSLFEEKRRQSEQNPTLQKRWVSVSIFRKTLRN